VKYPDRLEATHLRHEYIDDHQIEGRVLESDETGRAAVGDRDFEAASVEPRLYRKANVRVIVDNQNPTHMEVPQPSATRWTNTCIAPGMVYRHESAPFAASRRRGTVSARKGHRNFLQLRDFSHFVT